MRSSSGRLRLAAGALALVTLLTGCGTVSGSPGTSSTATTVAAESAMAADQVHSIAIDVDTAALQKMLQTYVDSGEKEWVKADVTIDGQKFTGVGIKLKGNSSLRGITVSTPAQNLPLRIRLDKYVDGQNIDGYNDFTVRSNSTTTSLNEAVSLELLGQAGLASEKAIATRFSVNGSTEVLRLTVQNLDDTWVEQNFPDAGDDSVLYKADADGNWSWRGKDGDYTSSFEIEAGKEDYAPLVELLDLLNNGTAAELKEKLPTLVDLDSFASYLAFQNLVDNFDDIDGPGNNSYLFWDSATKKFTVVAWDHNMTFGVRGGGGQPGGGGGQPGGGGGQPGGGGGQPGGGGGQPGGGRPADSTAAPGGQPNGQPGGGGRQRSNPLVTAFNANTEWKALYDQKLAALTTTLKTSGALTKSLDAWVATLKAGASDLVSSDTLTAEADQIRTYAG